MTEVHKQNRRRAKPRLGLIPPPENASALANVHVCRFQGLWSILQVQNLDLLLLLQPDLHAGASC